MATAKALESGPPHRILWMTDMSSRAAGCHDAARWFAVQPTELGDDPAEVIVAHAMGVDSHETPDRTEQRRAEAKAHLAALAGDLESVGIASQAVVSRGRPLDVAKTLVDEHQIDLVVCGRTGISGLDKVLLGSTARRLVRELRVPVLVVHQQRFATPKRILCPVDPTDASSAVASESGIRVAAMLGRHAKARVTFLSVALATGFVPEDRIAVGNRLEQKVNQVLAGMGPARTAGLDSGCRVVLAQEIPDGVIDAAGNADLVVLGASGRSGLARLVLGSVAESLVERSPTHTLVTH